MIDRDAMLVTQEEYISVAWISPKLLRAQRDKALKAVQDWLQGLHEEAKAGGHWDAGTLWYLSREILAEKHIEIVPLE
jgi:hypothetical protein